mgnify:CR=1 FL=1
MKLYYTPGACSQAPHIALQELGLPFEAVKVDLMKHTLPDGSDFRAINPKGYVPLLQLDDGTTITVGAGAIIAPSRTTPATTPPTRRAFSVMSSFARRRTRSRSRLLI